MTIEDLIFRMMLPSSNTCAIAFAHICGKKIIENNNIPIKPTFNECITAFISAMNKKAMEIGCTNTTFTTPSSLNITNLSCADDLLKIVIEACSYTSILKIWNRKTYTISY